jgi:hypothetical protein
MSFHKTYRHIEELGIWVHHELSTYDKKMITRARNKKLKAEAAAEAAKRTEEISSESAKRQKESVIYMMTDDGQMVPRDNNR